MEFTDVKIFKAKRRGPVLGYANVILDNCFIIRGITLLEKEKVGRFLSMPARRVLDERRIYRDLCHPLSSDVRVVLTEAVFAAYDEFIKNEPKEE